MYCNNSIQFIYCVEMFTPYHFNKCFSNGGSCLRLVFSGLMGFAKAKKKKNLERRSAGLPTHTPLQKVAVVPM